jgi:iron only hydrogenase large subunit-like protein
VINRINCSKPRRKFMNNIESEVKILDKYKMMIFNELVKSIWYDKTDDIDKIPDKILNEDSTYEEKFDKQTIVNLIRIVMGLEAADDSPKTIKDILQEAKDLGEIKEPIVSVIKDACKYCDQNTGEDESCTVRDKHMSHHEESSCSTCGDCISACKLGAISDKIQFVPMIDLLKDDNKPVYAIVAPAFVGQFGNEATPGKLRSALKEMGFKDMVEVSLAADMLTAKEAYEYQHHIENKESGYFITSCCCPIWVSLIQHSFPEIIENVSLSVSPMVACGRAIKFLDPDAKVVFIGPCIAKKKEAILDDIKDAVDFVLTFKELEEIFDALEIKPEELEDEERTEASAAGRVYARTGGVSKAVESSVKRLNKDIPFVATSFDGAKNCKEGMKKVINKELEATFIEGMGCVGGCVGGPKRILSVEEGTQNVNDYCDATNMETPFDNVNVLQFLTSLGIKRLESLGEKEEEQVKNIFSRDFINKK